MLERPHARLSQAFLDDARGIGDVLGAASEVTMPWLLIHGSDDETAHEHGKHQGCRAKGPPVREPKIRHSGWS